jgi:hypothetical protein
LFNWNNLTCLHKETTMTIILREHICSHMIHQHKMLVGVCVLVSVL